MTSKVSFHDLFPRFGISVNSKGTIQEIQKYAHIYGGNILMNNFIGIDKAKPYRLSYFLNKYPFEFMIYGIELTEDEYETQKLAWNGETFISVKPNAEIVLIDNSYLLLR
jgi:hypothetical protein